MRPWRYLLALVALAVAAAVVRGQAGYARLAYARAQGAAPCVRIAVLNFGPPPQWVGETENILGADVVAEDWKAAIPLLEKARVDVLVVRVQGPSGRMEAAREFCDLFEKECKPRFRTVAWIGQGLNEGVVAILPIEEWVFAPDGVLAGTTCRGWGSCSRAMSDPPIEEWLAAADRASAEGGRSPSIGRSFLIDSALSADIDRGSSIVRWRDDEEGEMLLNRSGRTISINARDAVKTRLATGIAGDRDELQKALGVANAEWVGEDAEALLEQAMRERSVALRGLRMEVEHFRRDLERVRAESAPSDSVIKRLSAALSRIESASAKSPRFAVQVCVTAQWVKEQRHTLESLGLAASPSPVTPSPTPGHGPGPSQLPQQPRR